MAPGQPRQVEDALDQPALLSTSRLFDMDNKWEE